MAECISSSTDPPPTSEASRRGLGWDVKITLWLRLQALLSNLADSGSARGKGGAAGADSGSARGKESAAGADSGSARRKGGAVAGAPARESHGRGPESERSLLSSQMAYLVPVS